MSANIFVDADSCPKIVRDFVAKYSQKFNIALFFVANKIILLENPPKNFNMIVCPKEAQAADNYILCNALPSTSLVITRDILLANALLNKGICVINDRGTCWTKENIKTSALKKLKSSNNYYSSGYANKIAEILSLICINARTTSGSKCLPASS